MKRLVETYLLPIVYGAILGLIGWALILMAEASSVDTAGLDRSPRPDMANSPPWQPIPVTHGASVHVVAPSDVK